MVRDFSVIRSVAPFRVWVEWKLDLTREFEPVANTKQSINDCGVVGKVIVV